jgi:hypothetical protein
LRETDHDVYVHNTKRNIKVMIQKQRFAAILIATALSASTFAAPMASAATAKPSTPDGCPNQDYYTVSGPSGTFVADPSKQVYGEAGITISVSAAAGTTFSGTVSGGVSGDISAIVAAASISIGTSVTYSKTTTVTLSGSWTVKLKSGQTLGWIALGSEGYTMKWAYDQETTKCTSTVIRSGTAQLPSISPVVGNSYNQ